MAFITYKPGDRAKIMMRASAWYNKDYYPVIGQDKATGRVTLDTPGGLRSYSWAVLKKYVPPPGATAKALPSPQALPEKSDDQQGLYDFFAARNSDSNDHKCPACGRLGMPMFNRFLCTNSKCRNGGKK